MTRKPVRYWNTDTIAEAIVAFVARYHHLPSRHDFEAANGLPSLRHQTRIDTILPPSP
jgi:hypothetical protein